MSLKQKAKELKSALPAVFLALKDKETPWYAKMIAAVTVCYALSPIDLVPDFIPVLGYLDDIILLPALVALTVKLISPTVWERCLADSKKMWANGKPTKWYCAIPIALIWLMLLCLVLKLIF